MSKNTDSQGNLTTHGFKAALRQGPYTFPGCYPCFFLTSDGGVLSFASAKENLRSILSSIRTDCNDGWKVVAVDVNYEDANLFCDHSGERIESAYAEDESL